MKVGVAVGARAGGDSQSVRSDWTRAEAESLYDLPFADLLFQAQSVHREHFDANRIETATLLSIKTGGYHLWFVPVTRATGCVQLFLIGRTCKLP